MKPELPVLLILITVALIAGCLSGIQSAPYGNATSGKQLYDVDELATWKYAVIMNSSDAISTWNMTINSSQGEPRHMTVGTVGNGMDILYDIWWNTTTYQISRMHAKGTIGDYYQDKDVSPMQIYTLPDVGLTYYFVPFQLAGNVTVRGVDGNLSRVNVFTAADNKGFRVTYWVHPDMPLPVKIEMTSAEFRITMMLLDYTTVS